MNLREWREHRNKGEEAQLPSGLEIRVRRVSLPDLAAQGKIPQTLQPQIDEIVSLTKRGQTPSINQLGEMTGLLDGVCRACIVEPSDLDVAELDFTDKMAIFAWANEVATGLKTFRSEQSQPVGVG
jgi:hypothetical protein